MRHERILILAGTAEARALANALVALGLDVVSSFAGVTQDPLLPVGEIHRGGFGGAEGLAAYLRDEDITRVVDATHPFAAQMSAHAHAACAASGVPLLRLERPAWETQAGDSWLVVASMGEAVERIPAGARLLVTTGRKGLRPLITRPDLSGVIRSIEPPVEEMPQGWSVLLDRPPHDLQSELDLLGRERITCLLSKNAGGDSTVAKLDAARQLGLTVVMIGRPFKSPCPTVSSVAEALLGITGQAG
jgi:precorrin-6A/cobalt-precorrin-6A reductase